MKHAYLPKYGHACCPNCKSEIDIANTNGIFQLRGCAPSKSKKNLTNRHTQTADSIQSPWLDSTKGNLFRDQFKLIAERKIDPEIREWGPYFTPLKFCQWIYDHKGVDIFFRGLARYAPMFPVFAYHGGIAVWTSPPPSGLGNAIYMVMGHDTEGRLRLVGGNYFNEPACRHSPSKAPLNFFDQFDTADKRVQRQLVEDIVEKSIRPEDKICVENTYKECKLFHTMAIYITVLTDTGSLFHPDKAVIEGVKPADFAYEFLGEIK